MLGASLDRVDVKLDIHANNAKENDFRIISCLIKISKKIKYK